MWFRKNANRIQTDLVYLPIKWTAYHIQHGYGKETKQLQNYVNGLPKNIKFFTVVQYDDGLLVDLPNCLIFSAGGKPDSAIPIPLVSDMHDRRYATEKEMYVASFVGDVHTHPIRSRMIEVLSKESRFYFDKAGVKEFEYAMANSYFALCPRGYGKTSFRLYEAMQMGCVPVYISDEHWLPFHEFIDWEKFCICITTEELPALKKLLQRHIDDGTWEDMMANCLNVYNSVFEYEHCFEVMKGILEGSK